MESECARVGRLQDEVLDRLRADGPAHSRLLDVVRILDLAHIEATRGADDAVCAFIVLVLALASDATSAAVAEAIPVARANVEAVAHAARAFVGSPDETTSDAFHAAATAAFPFGPGDGCFAVAELWEHGTPGAGCASSAGCLMAMAHFIGAEATLSSLERELSAWVADQMQA